MNEIDVVGLSWERARPLLDRRQAQYELTFTAPPRRPVAPPTRLYIVRQRRDETGCYRLVAAEAPARENGTGGGTAPAAATDPL